jgi:putative protease
VKNTPEVLAPAGSPDCLPAAVAGGAHAVYLGLRHFNARGRAENFRLAELPRHVRYLHHHGVKCYVVLNTLVHEDEFPKALHLAAHAAAAGVDAAIVQDLGLWTALRRTVPSLPLHASTQMTIHHPSQVEVLARLGAERVILARELSLAEVAACTATAHRLGIETEHFVHGALCYAFSGQCLMSNFAGCRSANRGTCAQNCRFVYTGPGTAPEGDTVLSMKDFSLIARIGELADAGVASLKIEGRLKGSDYVYTVSRLYRAAVDAWAARHAPGKQSPSTAPTLAQARELLKDVFARPHTEAPIDGVYGESSRLHRAEPESDRRPDAELRAFDRNAGTALVAARTAPAAGQGFRFAVGMFTGGFLVLAADRAGDGLWRLKVRTAPNGPFVPPGTPLFRNADHERRREAEAAMAAVPIDARGIGDVPVDLSVRGRPGEPLAATFTAADGRSASLVSPAPIQAATGRPLTAEDLTATLGALGGTGFALRHLDDALDDACFVPAKLLKELRRTAVDRLNALPVAEPAAPDWTVAESAPRRRSTALWVAVGSADAARAALSAGADAVWLECPADGLPDDLRTDRRCWLRLPATSPPLADLARIGLPVVAGHVGHLAAAIAAGLPAVADHACNVYSTATIDCLAGLGAQAAVVSLECSAREIAKLAARCGDRPTGLAVVVAGRLPAMLTRQDHGLATGERRRITASDREGGLSYDLERRAHDTVVFEARQLCAPAAAQATAGLVDAWVLEFGHHAPAAVATLVAAYAGLRAGADATAVAALHGGHADAGTFPGHLEIGSRALDEMADQFA